MSRAGNEDRRPRTPSRTGFLACLALAAFVVGWTVVAVEGRAAAAQQVADRAALRNLDLTISKTATTKLGTAIVEPEGWIRYDLTIENNGNEATPAITVYDRLPKQTEFVSASPEGKFDQGEVTWSVESLAAQTKVQLAFTVKVDAATQVGAEIVNQDYGIVGQDAPEPEPVVVKVVELERLYMPLMTRRDPQPRQLEIGGDFDEKEHWAKWTQQSAQGHKLISNQVRARSDGWAAWLAGEDQARDSLCQQVSLPKGSVWAKLEWYWWSWRAEGGDRDEDRLQVKLYWDGVLDATKPLAYENYSGHGWDPGELETGRYWSPQQPPEKLEICFVAETDSSQPTHFIVDDVALVVFALGD